MCFPRLKINLEKIHHNAKIINDRCAASGISVVGVTKCVLANERVSLNLRRAGINILADSRLLNIRRLWKITGDPERIMMLRTPMKGEIEELINICGTSLNTQEKTAELISEACLKYEKPHKIIIMVEIDDEREGIFPEEVTGFCKRLMSKNRFLKIGGIGTNARCINSNGPTSKSIDILVSLKKEVEEKLGLRLDVVSGGNSSIWDMIDSGDLSHEVNQVRIGEAIFLGHETKGYRHISGTFQDCFLLEGEIIEVKRKKGVPYRIIAALGLMDAMLSDLTVADKRLHPAGQSSDHTVLDINAGRTIGKNEFSNFEVGGIISFNLNYFGLLSCMASPFVRKKFI
jgi:ornithine racemase